MTLADSVAVPLLSAVADVGGEVFTRPPWREPYAQARTVAARLLADSARPGFVLAVARQGHEVVGFAYGYRCSALAATAARPCGADFTLKELGVLPDFRGLSIGVALHDQVLAASGGGPWWLITHVNATAALGLYHRRGWQAVSRHPTDTTRIIMRKAVPSPPPWPLLTSSCRNLREPLAAGNRLLCRAEPSGTVARTL
ncbi:GNAT family N-acetyltransferase [Acrocarpospora catenulata]|uniref:GNAT family N-acetyltransferase n=1 Tax=Acrocarpospora catenulata TaxID=2836182 RepID=UPI001BDA66A9|nr:GNAT family N-acetyltransferase [Acrocarpospora catenulata]